MAIFLSQFSKIDEDKAIALESKSQYLIQSTVQGSRAREYIVSYTQLCYFHLLNHVYLKSY